jgi:hypothetical protein
MRRNPFVIIGVVLIAFFARRATADSVTPENALKAYEVALSRLACVRFDANVKRHGTTQRGGSYDAEDSWRVLRDRNRWKLSCEETTTIITRKGKRSSHQEAYECVVPGAKEYSDLRIRKDAKSGKIGYLVANLSRTTEEEQREIAAEDDFMLVFGYLQGNGKMMYLPDILKRLDLQTSQDVLEGRQVVLLTGKGPFGAYELWLDPDYGFLPRRIRVRKGASDFAGERRLSSYPGLREMRTDVEVSRLEKIGDAAIIADFTIDDRTIYEDRQVKSHATCALSNIDLSPDVSSQEAFQVSLDIPNGAEVQVDDALTIRHVWENGHIVKWVDNELSKELSGHSFLGGPGSVRGWMLIFSIVLFAVVLALLIRKRRAAAQ